MLFQVLTTTISSPVPGVAETPMMLRVCALENALDSSSGLNVDGLNVDGENVDGLNVV